MAAGVLAQSELARQAVRNHDQAGALDHIRQAQANVAEIQSRSAGQPQPLLVPIRRETETTTTYNDVKRSHSGEMTANRLKKHTHVGEVEQQTVAESLNVTASAEHLRAAQTALEQTDWTAAENHLAGVSTLVRSNTKDEVPLLEAQRNLSLARARLVEQKESAAVAPLRAAERALSDFEKQNSGPRSQQAAEMRVNIEAMAAHIHHDASVAKLDDWLHTLDLWQK
ncbi:MAG: hypothetical protein C5B56_13880 [Proteobacteria bacterium]|nr:MAG: hypothetical protein C5B56_13880 [Pseudomonadota bacterium]